MNCVIFIFAKMAVERERERVIVSKRTIENLKRSKVF